MKKVIAILLCLVFAFPFSAGAKVVTEYESEDLKTPLAPSNETAAAVGTVLDINAASCILMESTTGQILYENNSHEKLAPASITKIMSLLLIFEAIDAGNLTLDTTLSASAHACSMGGSQIWLEENEQMTVHDLLKATIVGSANDATVVLAEAVAGTEDAFVERMNQKAKELGMTDSHFVNTTGLDADGHLTSAHDVAVASKELVKHKLVKEYSTIWMDSLRGGESELVNTNKLVRFYDGCTGLKTGTTSKAGCCLSATAERDGLSLVAVVMNSPDSNSRFNGARKLLDFGFANWSFAKLLVTPELLKPIKITNGTKLSLATESEGDKSVLVQKGKADEITESVEIKEEMKATVEKGECVGMARYMLDGTEIASINILPAETVYEMTFLRALKRLLMFCFSV